MKPVLSSFIFSEDTQQITNPAGSTLHIVNPLNLIRPQFIPSGYSFSVSFGILKIDPKRDYKIQFQLLHPSGNIAVDTNEINLTSPPIADQTLPSDSHGAMLNFDFRNVPLREIGEYKGVVKVDGEVIGEYPLYVSPLEKL